MVGHIRRANKPRLLRIFGRLLLQYLKCLAPIIEFIIMGVWDNIKGIIHGAIKVIQGIILVFTGIFTGNWKTLWKGIKDILRRCYRSHLELYQPIIYWKEF
jgi:phage-related protein